jgi:hypothetical protein
MAVRHGCVRFGLAAGMIAVAAATMSACGGGALTDTGSTRQPGAASAQPPAPGGQAGLAGAVSKLGLISQDGCQTEPPERIYPVCDRYLAEVRSAASTVRNGATGLPNASAVQASATGALAAADAFDRDGCSAGPDGPGAGNAGRCADDLRQVRAGVAALVAQTKGVGGR